MGHKYIEKHRSKSGKWVYTYASKSKAPEGWMTPTEYAKRKNRVKRSNAMSVVNVARKAYKVIRKKGKQTYKKAKRSNEMRVGRSFINSIAKVGGQIARYGAWASNKPKL